MKGQKNIKFFTRRQAWSISTSQRCESFKWMHWIACSSLEYRFLPTIALHLTITNFMRMSEEGTPRWSPFLCWIILHLYWTVYLLMSSTPDFGRMIIVLWVKEARRLLKYAIIRFAHFTCFVIQYPFSWWTMNVHISLKASFPPCWSCRKTLNSLILNGICVKYKNRREPCSSLYKFFFFYIRRWDRV